MSPRRTLVRRLDALADRQAPRPTPALLAYARAVIAFGGVVPTPAASKKLAWWLDGGWRAGT